MNIKRAPENLVRVINHHGPHPSEYHKLVYDRIRQALKGQKPYTKAYKETLIKILNQLGLECQTPGKALNNMITKYGTDRLL